LETHAGVRGFSDKERFGSLWPDLCQRRWFPAKFGDGRQRNLAVDGVEQVVGLKPIGLFKWENIGCFSCFIYIYIHTYIVFSFTALKPNSYLWNNKKEEGDFGADEKIYFHIFKKEEGKIII
jgi:hypothetical protein